MPARSVCLVTLSLSEAGPGPGRFGRQVSVHRHLPYHTTIPNTSYLSQLPLKQAVLLAPLRSVQSSVQLSSVHLSSEFSSVQFSSVQFSSVQLYIQSSVQFSSVRFTSSCNMASTPARLATIARQIPAASPCAPVLLLSQRNNPY